VSMTDEHRHPAHRRALPLIAGLAFAALLAVAGVRCSSPSAHDAAPQTATSASQTQGDEAEARAARAPERGTPAADESPGDAGAATTIGRLMRATDVHDRSLLADIERKTKRAPPASAFALLELRRAGKPRAELERFIQTELEGGVSVRLAAMQWLRAIHGEAEPSDDTELLREPGAPDPQPRTVKPPTKTTP
jgi:hypothetical protein